STNSLEGFLFPDTFQLRKPVKVSALVADQLKDFKRRFATVNLTAARRDHLTPFDVVTIASLIEGESATPHDDRLVSSVIYNRLRDHIMLGLDSTTRYATGNFTGPLTQSQLNSSSPYNTRNHFGLPPGPINSPGLTALRAAAAPAHSNYLYFFTKPCTNQAVFASSYAQFQLLLVRDRRNHCP
ncbi:MAG TPA: endolytic transglycosylase MltG, partial [Solirubrobacteraceae bacterium]|nr:endolytic transglycosylase MltG [Solirubrobacteraceae bacterium]